MEIISERCQHRDESLASIGQGENAECVERVWSVRDGWEQPIGVSFVHTLQEEGDNSEKPTGFRTEISEHWRGGRKFDRGCETPGVVCVENSSPLSLPLPGKPLGIPLVVLGNSRE